jgi:hypothetical protein
MMTSPLKVGLVGLDTSHCIAFTQILNDPQYPYYLPGARVIGAVPAGSRLFSLCRDRVKDLTEELSNSYGIPLYASIPELAAKVDALMLLSGDGRQHLEQFSQMAVGKPVFIDKPLAVSSAQGYQIAQLAQRTQTPILSCSSLRFAAGIADLDTQTSAVVAAEAFGPAPIYPDYPGLFWYGIHSAEILYAVMGKGCLRLRCLSYPQMDLIIGEWSNERTGIIHATRYPHNAFGCTVHTSSDVQFGLAEENPPYYFRLMEKILKFFQERTSPVAIEETLEIIAFVEAANLSKERNGKLLELRRGWTQYNLRGD